MKFREMLPWRHHGNDLTAPDFDQPFDKMFRDMRDMMRRFDQDWWKDEPGKNLFVPSLDIAEDDKVYTLTAELPGIEPDKVTLDMDGDHLTIRGEKIEEKTAKDKTWHRRETMRGSFRRILQLPPDADRDGIKAAFRNGVLTVTIPKAAEPPKSARNIPITN